MCLLKVYVEGPGRDNKSLVATNIMYVLAEDNAFKMRNVDGEEKILYGVKFLMVDAINSVLILKAEREEEASAGG